MDIRLLEYAIEVHKTKNFTKAAQHLHIAQPSLSKQIAKLETELGVALFTRKPGTVETTSDGLHFIQQAEKIVQLHHNLQRDMQERKTEMQGELFIGTTTITGGHLLPPLLKKYQEQHSQVAVRLIEHSSEALIEQTAQGLIDVSILTLPIEDERLETQPMLTEPLYLALPAEPVQWLPEAIQNKISSGEELPLSLLQQAPFVLLKQGFGFRQAVMELCARSGFEPKIAYETSSIETAQSFVAHGLGITIVPKMAMKQHRFITYISLAGSPTRTLVFAYQKKRYLSLNARALINVYQHHKEF